VAISFVSAALGGTTTTTSFSITLPATAAGDIIILEFCHRGTGNGTIGGTYSGPAFALKHSQLFATSAFSGKTYWSRATGNHSGQTVTGSGLTNACAAIVTVYRGALASGDPLADATIVGEQNASGNETQAQISNATAGAWVVLVVVNSPDLAVATQACTTPGTLTERAERLSTGGTDASIAHASAAKAGTGGTGALTWTQTNAASGSWAYAITPEPEAPAEIVGTLSVTLGALTLASGAAADVRGALAVTLGALAVAGEAVAEVRGVGATTLEAMALAATGEVTSALAEIVGTLAVTLDAMSVAGDVHAFVQGSGSSSLAAMTAAGSAQVAVTGGADAALSTMTLVGAGAVDLSATLAVQLGALGAAGAGQVATSGALLKTLATMGLTASGTSGGAPPSGGEHSVTWVC
jgi:hypothetical protein